MCRGFESLRAHHYGGRSSIGRAPDCGSGGSRFETCRPPQNFFQTASPDIGVSPSGKARDFDSRIRRFKSCHPSQTKFAGSATTPKPTNSQVRLPHPSQQIRRFGCCRPKSVLPPSDFGRKVPQQGPLAQMVEHLTFNQGVPGSNPGWTTTFDFKNRIR